MASITAISYTDFRARLAEVWESVVNDSLPHIITRRGKENLVVLKQSDYEGMNETMYLLSSKANRDALDKAMAEVARGEAVPFDPTTMTPAEAEQALAHIELDEDDM